MTETTGSGTGTTVYPKKRVPVSLIVLAITFVGITSSAFAGLGVRYTSPARALDEHVVQFAAHVKDYEVYVSRQDATAELVDAQTRLTCLRTGADTLIMLNLTAFCDEKGIRR